MKEHASDLEAADCFLESFAKEKGEKWMAAHWVVKDGKIRLHLTTYKFPKDDYLSVVGLLSNHLFEKNMLEANKLPDSPLPPARGFDPWTSKDGADPLGETGPFGVVDENKEPDEDNHEPEYGREDLFSDKGFDNGEPENEQN